MLPSVYSCLTFAGSLALGPLFLLSGRGRERLLQRYGRWQLALDGCLWLHGASLGEIKGLVPLLNRLHELHPELPLLVTATSVTGLQSVPEYAAAARLLPFDSTPWVRAALSSVAPRALIISETELWPALMGEMSRRGVPSYLINGRISDRSFPRYMKLSSQVAPLLNSFEKLLVSSDKARDRFLSLGAVADKVAVVGNTKYDVPLQSAGERATLRRALFERDAPILTVGSIRPGEEAIWGEVFKRARTEQVPINIVFAPRHTEKFAFFENFFESLDLPVSLRSAGAAVPRSEGPHFLLLDTLGELRSVFAVSDAAFVGGTLANYGGHNPLEPAMYSVPVSVGPFTQNVDDIVEPMKERDAITVISTVDDAWNFVERTVRGDETLRRQGERGQDAWRANVGAVDRVVSYLNL